MASSDTRENQKEKERKSSVECCSSLFETQTAPPCPCGRLQLHLNCSRRSSDGRYDNCGLIEQEIESETLDVNAKLVVLDAPPY